MNYKVKYALLIFSYLIFTVYITGWFQYVLGYVGFQDAVRYQSGYEKMRYDTTHWLTIAFMDIFGIRGWHIVLGCLMLPYAVARLYGRRGLGYESAYNFYLYSPFILFLWVQNVYAQLLFMFFYIMYKADYNDKKPFKSDLYEGLALISHPAFSLLFIVEHYFEKRYKRMLLLLLVCATAYFFTPSYHGYSLLNQNAPDETSVIDVFLYINPFNMWTLPLNWYYIVVTLMGLLFHNGRYIMFAVLLQYYQNPPKIGKIWGLFINFLYFYYIWTLI